MSTSTCVTTVATGLGLPRCAEFVLQILLQGIANRALGVGAAHIQRNLVHALGLGRDLGPPQDEAHLRAVAVPDDHLVAGLDHVGDMQAGLLRGLVLVFHRLVGGVLDQRIAADGDDCDFLRHSCSAPFH